MNKEDNKYTAEQLLIGGVIYCKFLVDLLPRKDFTCDAFIHGVDDFKQQEFKTEESAICWIGSQTFGEYTISKIYCR